MAEKLWQTSPGNGTWEAATLTDARETSRSIDEKAADWIARLDRGPLTEEEAQALESWLAGDPRRRGALLRAGSLSALSESAQAFRHHFQPVQSRPDAAPIPDDVPYDNLADQGGTPRPTR